MTRRPGWADYQDKMSRVSAYIHDHLDQDLDMDRLADVACLSPSHWHRIYRGLKGETIIQTVRRLRLERAALELIRTDRGLDEIARRSGYPNLRSFSRAFSKDYNVPPGAYRDRGRLVRPRGVPKDGSLHMYEVKIEERAEAQLIYLPFTGPYEEIGRVVEPLVGAAVSQKLMPPDAIFVGVYFDDPEITAPERLRSRACIPVADASVAEDPLQSMVLEAGEYVVLHHVGPYAELKGAIDWLYGEWMANSGRMPGEGPLSAHFLNKPTDVSPEELMTDIMVPLKP